MTVQDQGQPQGGFARRQPWPARRGIMRPGLIMVLLAVLAAVGLALWPGVRPAPSSAAPSHEYRLLDAPPSAAAVALAGMLGEGFQARRLELGVPGDGASDATVPVHAEAALAPDGTAHLLGWQSQGPQPVLRRDIRPDEDLRLAEALASHLPAGSTILALPALSRRLAAFSPAAWPLASEAEPLAIPAPWQRHGAAVAAVEAAQWGGPATPGIEGEHLSAFIDALLAEDVHGAARLRVLAGAGEAYALVHLDDAFQLGLLREGRMEMARRTFAANAFSHDLAREARTWGAANDHAAWAIDRSDDGRLRGQYLADSAETATLIAQLLPFNTSRLDAVPGLRLVWQSGGYWLYRISPVESRD